MIVINEGEKRNIEFSVKRNRGSGAITLTAPERRILNSQRVLIINFDWAAAIWDSTDEILFALFDSTAAGLTVAGRYYMQLRGTIGSERYGGEIVVQLREWGP